MASRGLSLMSTMARTLRAAPLALRMTTRFLPGASRQPSSGCNGQLSTRARSRVRPPLIRNAVRGTMRPSTRHSSWTLLKFVLALSWLLAACGDPRASWTAQDKENIAHFFASQKADLAAVRLANSGVAFSMMSETERTELLRLKRLALSEAKLLKDEVLSKANRDLPQRFRELYQRSLELRLQNLEIGDIKAELEGSALHDQWVDWYNANRSAIKIPK